MDKGEIGGEAVDSSIEVIGFTQREKKAIISQPISFRISHALPDTLKIKQSSPFVDGFAQGFSQITGIDLEILDFVEHPTVNTYHNITISSYYDLVRESRDLTQQARALVADPEFKKCYMKQPLFEDKPRSMFYHDDEKKFATLVEGHLNAQPYIERYKQIETLMGRIAAIFYIRDIAINELAKQPDIKLSQQQQDASSILKTALSQRWYRTNLSTMNTEEIDMMIDPSHKVILAQNTDEAFGKVIDYIVTDLGGENESVDVFIKMIDKCFDYIDLADPPICANTGPFNLDEIAQVKSKIGNIFSIIPLSEFKAKSWRTTNIGFLPGDDAFFQHLERQYPELYRVCVGRLVYWLSSQQIGQPLFDSQVNGVTINMKKRLHMYEIFQTNFPRVLSRVPNHEQCRPAVNYDTEGKINYMRDLVN